MCFPYEKAINYENERHLSKCNIKKANIFKVLCGNHDKKIFEKIENSEFEQNDKEQCFQFSLRAFIFYYSDQLIRKDIETTRTIDLRARLSYPIDDAYFEKFKNINESKDYDQLVYNVLVLNKKIQFVSSVTLTPKHGYWGNKDNLMFVNVFPRELDSIVIISYFKDEKHLFEDKVGKLKSYNESNQEKNSKII